MQFAPFLPDNAIELVEQIETALADGIDDVIQRLPGVITEQPDFTVFFGV
jgi:hypothetical protein